MAGYVKAYKDELLKPTNKTKFIIKLLYKEDEVQKKIHRKATLALGSSMLISRVTQTPPHRVERTRKLPLAASMQLCRLYRTPYPWLPLPLNLADL